MERTSGALLAGLDVHDSDADIVFVFVAMEKLDL